jgi:hypothetical protein
VLPPELEEDEPQAARTGPRVSAALAAPASLMSIRRLIAPSAIDLSSICTRALTRYTLAGRTLNDRSLSCQLLRTQV